MYKYKGYIIARGGYYGTTDDRADRWYINHKDAEFINNRGNGYDTVKAAKQAIDQTA